jgi:hypothetical protein
MVIKFAIHRRYFSLVSACFTIADICICICCRNVCCCINISCAVCCICIDSINILILLSILSPLLALDHIATIVIIVASSLLQCECCADRCHIHRCRRCLIILLSSCHHCLTPADCHVASCRAAAYHPPVLAPLLISYSSCHLHPVAHLGGCQCTPLAVPVPHRCPFIREGSAKALPPPPPAADGQSAGERHCRNPLGQRLSSSLSSLMGLHPPPPHNPVIVVILCLLVAGGGMAAGGGEDATAHCCGILGVRHCHCPAPTPVEPALFVMLRPRRPACIAPLPSRTTRIIG